MDGYLKIKTKIDNKDLDKGIVELENKIKNLQEDNSKNSLEQSSLQKEIDDYKELQSNADAYKQKIKELNNEKNYLLNGGLKNSDVLQYNSLLAQIDQTKQKYAQATAEIDKQTPKLAKVEAKLSKIKGKQTENNAKIQQYKQKIDQIKMDKTKKEIDNIGKGITSQIGKLGKMAMAVVGVRTAFSAVSRVINMVKQYNPQISADFEYMGYCIANIVAPAVQKLVQLLYKVFSYVNAITTAWFGINLFSKSSAKNFDKMQSSAKDMQKSMQSFDEANVLQDSNASSSDGTGSSMPSMDLSNMQGEVPEWLQWIIDNKELVTSVLTGIASGILAIKLGLTGIESLGIVLIITGIVKGIQDVINLIKEPTWENFGKVVTDIGLIILGIGILIGGVPAIIIGALTLIIGYMITHWNELKEGFKLLWSFIVEIFWSLISAVEGIFTYLALIIRAPFDTLWDVVTGVFNGIKTILKGILQVFKGIFTGDMKTVLEGFKNIFKGVFDSLWSIAKAPINLIIRGINALISGINKINFNVPSWVPGIGGNKLGFNIPKIPLLARGTVVSKPTQAIIGEAGAEMIMPLENNLEWLDVLADKLANKIGASGGSFIIQLDSRTIQRGLAKRQQELAFATNGR